MGQDILMFWKKLETRGERYRTAFLSSLVIAIIIHLYKFTNTLPNHDSVYNYYSDQNMLGSGRWALSLACGISSYYDLPWVNGLLSCVYIALTVVVIAALFDMRNPVLIALSGALLAASPATTETFFFLFTADGYMIAMLLSALGVYLTRIGEKRLWRWIAGGICICVSCGIYQAYVSFALLLTVCCLARAILNKSCENRACFIWALRQAALYACALAAYYGVWKLLLAVCKTEANAYQGISEVGKRLDMGTIARGVVNAFRSVLLYLLQWNVLEHGMTLYGVLSLLTLCAAAGMLIAACIKSGAYRDAGKMLLLILCAASVVPFAGIWHLVSDSVSYRPMMLQSMTVLAIFTALLYEEWGGRIAKNAVCLLFALVIFQNALMANISYYTMQLCYQRSCAEGAEMMQAIHAMQNTDSFDRIAVVGSRIHEVQIDTVDPQSGRKLPGGEWHILSTKLEKTLLFDAEHTVFFLRTQYGMDLTPVSYAERSALLESEEVRAMGCWPSGSSVAVIGDTLVIKLSDYDVN